MCDKHYTFFLNHGYIPERTVYDPNDIMIDGDVCFMSLYDRKGLSTGVTIFNKCHFDEVKKYKWSLNSRGYPIYAGRQFLHHIAAGRKPGYVVDHIDGNPLNNLDSNLRLVTAKQNSWNRKSLGICKSHNKFKEWRAYITVNSKQIYLGSFEDKSQAIQARRQAEIQYFGKYARLTSKQEAKHGRING
jgi:hypothetical protein